MFRALIFKRTAQYMSLWNYSHFWQAAQDTEAEKLAHMSHWTNLSHAKINSSILHRGKTRSEIPSLHSFITITREFPIWKNWAGCCRFIPALDPPVPNPMDSVRIAHPALIYEAASHGGTAPTGSVLLLHCCSQGPLPVIYLCTFFAHLLSDRLFFTYNSLKYSA